MSRIPRSLFLVAATLAVHLGCGGNSEPPYQPAHVSKASFAVFSDPHIHDVAVLGASGPDYDADLAQDRKMWKESGEIVDAVVGDLKGKPIDFVLVPGDLTKDGEKVNHQLMAAKLSQLRAAGKKVFVVPGNHDVNNPHGKNYLTTPATKVAPTTATEFRQIYGDYGYNSALYTDANSLSYIAEPVPGVWLFAIDSCRWAENTSTPITAGAVSAATRTWLLERLSEAKVRGKTVLGMMHHGVVEHFAGQALQFPEYLVADRETLGKQLADNGLNVIFTGHYHANDVARRDFGTSELHDVETGSLVTAPCPYRTIELDVTKRTFAVTSTTVGATTGHPSDFISYAGQYLRTGLSSITTAMLIQGYNLDATTAGALTPLIVEAMMAHYGGDENIDALPEPARTTMKTTMATLRQSSDPTTRLLGDSVLSLWTDPAPTDNTFTIVLK